MSLLGIDVGTTGCKASVFSEEGVVLGAAYAEYDVDRPKPGWSQLDACAVWDAVKSTIGRAVLDAKGDPVRALAVSSLGEAMVPVSADRRILGPSILNDDTRGEEYLEALAERFDNPYLYGISGNTLGNHYSLPKLLWLREHEPDLYQQADAFLLWGSFVPFMLGAEATVDYSLANRTLLFDVNRKDWSRDLMARAGIEDAPLPPTCPSGTAIGTISKSAAEELGLPGNVTLVSGSHDQCANALGCGAIEPGRAMLGMGTYLCLAPVYDARPAAETMIPLGLNTEHHAVPDRFISFLYNQGGALLKWYRDTFAAAERDAARKRGEDVYDALLAEMPDKPGGVVVLPHFMPTGPPEFIGDSSGVMTGLRLGTQRGDILRGILEGTVFYLRECVEKLPGTGIVIDDVRVVGGGSKSDRWVQLCADILNRPFTRPKQSEAGVLGAAIMAGVASGVYQSFEEGVDALVQLERSFEPRGEVRAEYDAVFERYRQLWPTMRDYLVPVAESGLLEEGHAFVP